MLAKAPTDRFILKLLFIRKVLFYNIYFFFSHSTHTDCSTASPVYTPPSSLPTSPLLQIHCSFISLQKRDSPQPPLQAYHPNTPLQDALRLIRNICIKPGKGNSVGGEGFHEQVKESETPSKSCCYDLTNSPS